MIGIIARRFEWIVFLLAGMAFIVTMASAGSASADPRWNRDRNWDREYYRHGWHDDRVVVVAPYYPARRVYVEPAPVYYAPPPAPAYYAPQPAPVYTQRVACGNGLPPESIIGAIGGGLIGSTIGRGNGRVAAVAGGTLIGAMLGQSYSQNCVYQSFEYAPVGQPVAWTDGSARYQMQPQNIYRSDNGQYCREYQATAWVGGRQQQTYGTACRQPDGNWQVISSN